MEIFSYQESMTSMSLWIGDGQGNLQNSILLNGLTLERAYFNSAELFLRVYNHAGLL